MTTVITGRDLTITIDSVDYAPQVMEWRLAQSEDRQRFELISGATTKVLDVTGTLTVRMLSDWGDDGTGTSLCGALWDAVTDNPDTALDVVLGSDGDSWAGKVLPTHPDDGPGGSGKDAQEISYTFPVAPVADSGPFVRTAAVA